MIRNTVLEARAPRKIPRLPQINPVQSPSSTDFDLEHTISQPSHRPTQVELRAKRFRSASTRPPITCERTCKSRYAKKEKEKKKKEGATSFLCPRFPRICGFPNETFSLRDLDRCEAALSFSFPASAIVLMPIETASGVCGHDLDGSFSIIQ